MLRGVACTTSSQLGDFLPRPEQVLKRKPKQGGHEGKIDLSVLAQNDQGRLLATQLFMSGCKLRAQGAVLALVRAREP